MVKCQSRVIYVDDPCYGIIREVLEEKLVDIVRTGGSVTDPFVFSQSSFSVLIFS